MIHRGTPILFSPTDVASVLATLPTVAALIPDPEQEGVESDAFPSALRKTDRELYRWIANTHLEHLAEVVPLLERVLAAGCRFGNLLTTRSREQFVSHTAELLVAEDLLHRGYTVSTFGRANDPSPDLHVTGDGIDIIVEVYSPRELTAIDEWTHEVSDLMQYVDVPASYRSSVDTRHEQTIPPERGVQLDPRAPAKIIEETRDDVMAQIAEDVETALRELKPLTKTYWHGNYALRTAVELSEVRAAPDRGPVRVGSISYPGFGGYSPAGVFRTVVERAEKKARRRQAHGEPASARALVVYMMSTKIADDLLHPAHMKGAEEALGNLEPQDFGLDAIAFVVRTLPRGVGAILWIADDATLTEPQVRALFDAAPESRRDPVD